MIIVIKDLQNAALKNTIGFSYDRTGYTDEKTLEIDMLSAAAELVDNWCQRKGIDYYSVDWEVIF